MRRQQVLQVGMAVVLMVFFLIGCGGDAPTAVSEAPAATSAPEQAATPTPEPPPATPTPEPPTATPIPPTATPVPATPTPEPPTATPTPSGPKAGHWEGEDKAFVSFDITDDGDIQNFEVDAKICTLTLEKITVGADGTFDFTESATSVETGEVIEEAVRITGAFESATHMTGTLVLGVCEDKELISISADAEGVVKEGAPSFSLSAEWKGLTEAPLPTEEPDAVLPSEHDETPVELISEHDEAPTEHNE